MSPVNGIEIGRKLLRADPDVYLVYLAAHPEYEFESYKLEVDQYILKEEFWHLWECASESGKKICCTARRSVQHISYLLNYSRHSSSAMASICPLLSAFRADLMVTSVSSQVMFLLFSNFPFMILLARGAQEPFSIRPMVRFW